MSRMTNEPNDLLGELLSPESRSLVVSLALVVVSVSVITIITNETHHRVVRDARLARVMRTASDRDDDDRGLKTLRRDRSTDRRPPRRRAMRWMTRVNAVGRSRIQR